MNNIERLVSALSYDPFNPELNFACAIEYEKLNQMASAISFYLRTAEYGYDTHHNFVYTSLLKMANCYESQKNREWTVSNTLLQAVSYMPQRPEAWFLLSRFHERSGNWQEAYSFANTGLLYSSVNNPMLPSDVEYPGEYGLLFEKYVCGWWIGRKEESINGFIYLLDKYSMSQTFIDACINNLERIRK